MREIKIFGTGGQGAVIAGKIFADAAAKGGFFVQSFSAYGAERRGGKVESFVRLSKEPVSIHCKMYAPNFIVMMDEIFVQDSVNLSANGSEECVLINSANPPEHFNENGKRNIITIDAYGIAKENGVLLPNGKPIINTTILGALAGIIPAVDINDVKEAIREGKIPSPNKNIDAAQKAYLMVKEGYQEEPANRKVKISSNPVKTPVYLTKQPPCETQCPVGHTVLKTLDLVRNERFEEALLNIKKENPFPSITGRVCFKTCETACSAGQFMDSISINAIERAVSDQSKSDSGLSKLQQPATEKTIAIIGSGPAGLSCALYASLMGHQVTVFEAMDEAGGIPRIGIPAYRLPRDIINREIQEIESLGVQIKTGVRIGQDLPFKTLKSEFDACFIAIGAHISKKMGIQGENGDNVISGLDYLKSIALGEEIRILENVVVVGGGNTALDAARSALRQGSKNVKILYRRSREEMPAYQEEINSALTEGIQIIEYMAPSEVIRTNHTVIGLKCLQTKLGEPDKSGRKQPVIVEGSDQLVPADMIITAIGETPDFKFLTENDLEIDDGLVQVDIFGGTFFPNVFAGGDITNTSWTVPEAMAAGKRAAVGIDLYLNNKMSTVKNISKKNSQTLDVSMSAYLETGKSLFNRNAITYDDLNFSYGVIKQRVKNNDLAINEQINTFKEIKKGISTKAASKESHRCFYCGSCNLCGNCYIFCPDMAIDFDEKSQSLTIDQKRCKSCGICIQECPRGAIAWKGVEV